MKNLVFQINISSNVVETSGRKKFKHYPNLYNFSNQKAEEYAKKVDADYICLKNKDWLGEEYAPAYHKLFVYELSKTYDKIFYSDADAIITKSCPNVFKYDTFSAILDGRNSSSGVSVRKRKNEIHSLPDTHNYFQSGMILFDKKFIELTKDRWKEELDFWKDVKSGQHDQSVLNVLVSKYYGDYNILSPDWGAWWKRGKYIIHYTGHIQKKEWSEDKFNKFESKL